MNSSAPIAIQFKGVNKSFGPVHANKNLNLSIGQGSIHGIIGENGAGKSTAMKILFGLYQADSGEVLLNGQPINFATPIQAMAAGIGMVHQHFMLGEPFSALDNLLLHQQGHGPFQIIDRKAEQEKLETIAQKYGFQIPWQLPVQKLSVGEQQRIEILKILSQNSKFLILDEPTAVLTPQEVKDLFQNLRQLRDEGRTILIITHKLKEVMQITDHVTIFRAGEVIAERETAKTTIDELAELMVGRKTKHLAPDSHKLEKNKHALEVRNLSINNEYHRLLVEELLVAKNEIVGVAGVEGNGQDLLIESILNPTTFAGKISGQIKINQHETLNLSASQIRSLSVGAFPEDRLRKGVLPGRPATENFLLGHHRKDQFKSGIQLNESALLNETQRAMDKFDVRPRNPLLTFQQFSGGNQQKFVVARELWNNPQFILAAQPTRGVDIGAIEFIHEQILQARNQGAGVLLISSELDEVLTLSDRIFVLYKGQLIAHFERHDFDEIKIGAAMGGKELS